MLFMKKINGIFNVLVVLALFLAGTPIQRVFAASLTVNTTSDVIADDGLCSLREAITAANTDTASGASGGECVAGSGADTITFDGSVFSTAQIITLTSALPTVTGTLVINGPGEALLTVDGANSYRVFYNGSGADLTLSDMTIANGSASGDKGAGIYVNASTLTASNVTLSGNTSSAYGGAIYVSNSSTVTLTDCTLTGNSIADGATSQGGAIYVSSGVNSVDLTRCTLTNNTARFGGAISTSGTLTINDSTLSGNTTTSNGGGAIYVQGGVTKTITLNNTTVSGNTASFGGGIMLVGGNLIVGHSTFSGNSATTTSGGGAIFAQGANSALTIFNSTFSGNSVTPTGTGGGLNIASTVSSITITNSTIAGNTASNSSGIRVTSTTATLNNNIIAYNTGSSTQCSFGANPVTIQYSLIEDESCGITNGVSGNLASDPLLSALADNGGSTQTRALSYGSPAINAGDNTLAVDDTSTTLSNDQRGNSYDRIVGGTVDMGAYESHDLVVDTTSDADLEGCSAAADDCSLRGAPPSPSTAVSSIRARSR